MSQALSKRARVGDTSERRGSIAMLNELYVADNIPKLFTQKGKECSTFWMCLRFVSQCLSTSYDLLLVSRIVTHTRSVPKWRLQSSILLSAPYRAAYTPSLPFLIIFHHLSATRHHTADPISFVCLFQTRQVSEHSSYVWSVLVSAFDTPHFRCK